MNVLLVCAAGMSTSLLVNNMKAVAADTDRIEAFPESKLKDLIEEFDVVLVGPQIRYKYPDIESVCKKHNKACGLIDMAAYGQMNGTVVYKQAQELLK